MKRLLAAGGQVFLVEVPEPDRRRGDVLVETISSVVSTGTETHIIRASVSREALETDQYPRSTPFGPQLRDGGVRWRGPQPNHAPPGYASLGYSLAGRVIAVGEDIADLSPGDLVACSGNQCSVHAERVAVPRNLVARVPHGVNPDEAAFVTLGSVAINSLRRSGCQFGETVVVLGLGVLGLLAVQVAATAGLRVIGIDPAEQRCDVARTLGVHDVIGADPAGAIALVKRVTDGFGADAVILTAATDSSEPLNLAFDLCRQRGVVVGVGLFGMCIERGKMFGGDVAFYPSVAYGPGRYDPVYEEGGVDYPIGYARWTENRNMQLFLQLLADGRVQVSPLAQRIVPLPEAPSAYQALLEHLPWPPTVVIQYGSR